MAASTTIPATPWGLAAHVDVEGGRVAVGVLGDGPPVVLTHGTPSWSYLWRHIAPRLCEHHTVYLWDLLGYGDSTPADGVQPSVALHARTLAELVAHWGLADPALVGHDIGGGAVLRAHLVHGVPARALVLLDTAVLAPWVTPASQHMQAHLDAYRSMPTPVFAELLGAHLRTAVQRPMPDDVVRAYLDPYSGPDGQQRWLDHVAGFTHDDTRDVVAHLDEITVPTQLVWGEDDKWLSLATAPAPCSHPRRRAGGHPRRRPFPHRGCSGRDPRRPHRRPASALTAMHPPACTHWSRTRPESGSPR